MPNNKRKAKEPMGHYNIIEFSRGQSSRIFTAISNEDKSSFVLKNGKPMAVVISNDRYEQLMAAGIDINDEDTWTINSFDK